MEYALSWKAKRRLISGGGDHVTSEITVTPLQISLIADPRASIRDAINGFRSRRNSKALLGKRGRRPD